MQNIEELKIEFIGGGEVLGFKFTQKAKFEKHYIYEVLSEEGAQHFEVFERRNTAKCIDFSQKLFSETDFAERYPKANDFGVWAWTTRTFDKALAIANRDELFEIREV